MSVKRYQILSTRVHDDEIVLFCQQWKQIRLDCKVYFYFSVRQENHELEKRFESKGCTVHYKQLRKLSEYSPVKKKYMVVYGSIHAVKKARKVLLYYDWEGVGNPFFPSPKACFFQTKNCSIGSWIDEEGNASNIMKIAPFSVAAFDIETLIPEGVNRFPNFSKPSDKIIYISLSFSIFGEEKIENVVLCLGDCEESTETEIQCFKKEHQLLNAFSHMLKERKVDILLSFNGKQYDTKYMNERAKRYKLFTSLRGFTLKALWQEALTKKKEYDMIKKNKLIKIKRYHIELAKKKKKSPRWIAIEEAVQKIYPELRLFKENYFPEAPYPYGILEKYNTEMDLLEAARYFQGDCTDFFLRSKDKKECKETVKTVSSAIGDQEVYYCELSGIIHIDLLMFFRRSPNYKFPSYKLSYLTKHFLPERSKIDLSYSDMWRFYRSDNPSLRKKCAEYCARDSEVLILLERSQLIITSMIELAKASYTHIDALQNNGQTQQCKNLTVHFCDKLGFAMDIDQTENKKADFQGAYVLDPKKGFYENPVTTLDFASLYPSIMRGWNLCWSTHVRNPTPQLENHPKAHKIGDNLFINEYRGVIPEVLTQLIGERNRVKKQMKQESDANTKSVLDKRQLSIKIMCNSMYGYFGAPGIMRRTEIAASVTQRGRELIAQTKEAVELSRFTRDEDGNLKFKKSGSIVPTVIYGDTDSVMVCSKQINSIEDCFDMGDLLADHITNTIFAPWPEIELENEKVTTRYCLF